SGDAREHVEENRKRAAMTLAGDCDLLTRRQVHGAKAIRVDTPWSLPAAPEADAMATTRRGAALGILTADCVPVLLADANAGVIGAAHAGWKGALAGIIESALAAMVGL